MIKSEEILKIRNFPTLVSFLVNSLNWPIDLDQFDDYETLAYTFSPEELEIKEDFIVKIKSIKQLRPIESLPWGIFWIDFVDKRLPITVLRRILNNFVIKKKPGKDSLSWKTEDLLFITGHGEKNSKAITFAHFQKKNKSKSILREFWWDESETNFRYISNKLDFLKWPKENENIDNWKDNWRNAFRGSIHETVKSVNELTEVLAYHAKEIRTRISEIYEISKEVSPLHKLYSDFKNKLIYDLTVDGFADMYAQTLTYGLFSARFMHTETNFTTSNTLNKIPQTNPFLKRLFKNILKISENKNIIEIFDDLGVGQLIEFLASLNSNQKDLTKEILFLFGRKSKGGREDPVVHFYEGFLDKYDRVNRSRRGVYYTPDSVVNFIVNTVDKILKKDFKIENGLSNDATWGELVDKKLILKPKVTENEWNNISTQQFIKILDPAVGTGSFINVVSNKIRENLEKNNHNNKIKDVNNLILEKIYGFEIMIAPYSICHLKIGLNLKNHNYNFEQNNKRLNVFLNNTLDPPKSENLGFFENYLSEESEQANKIKNYLFPVVMGNPPYHGLSSNKNDWAKKLIEPYKYCEGKHFGERKHWLNDDYVKFLRYGQEKINEANQGVLAFITNHAFLDNTTFRCMRLSLINSFDQIYILNLHGNANQRETSPDGSKDENIFDIKQGVSINIFIKNNKLERSIFYKDLWGERIKKYKFLNDNKNLKKIEWKKIIPIKPNYLLMPNKLTSDKYWENGLFINKIFSKGVTGVVTARDKLVIDFEKNDLKNKIKDFSNLKNKDEFVKKKYKSKDSRGWNFKNARRIISKEKTLDKFIKTIHYRPFDFRKIFYHNKMIDWGRQSTFKHLIQNNYGLVCMRLFSYNVPYYSYVLVSSEMVEARLFMSNKGICSFFPLYNYDDYSKNKYDNFTNEIKELYSKKYNEKFNSIQFFNYIYAILNCPTYRKKYFNNFKFEFPKIIFFDDFSKFQKLSLLGEELINIHLFKTKLNKNNFKIISDKDFEIEKIIFQDKKLFYNKYDYISNVDEEIIDFNIGGFAVVKNYLKSRKGRKLTKIEKNNLLNILEIIKQTIKLMKKIDDLYILN